MVSKLLLATQECYLAGEKGNADLYDLIRIMDHYKEIKDGLGLHKSPNQHGAFPVDAYSHTPAGAGAQQPGLTGQVKEDIISRFGELGVHIKKGTIILSPSLVNTKEILNSRKDFSFIDLQGNNAVVKLEAGQFAFTICQVPVIYTKGSTIQTTIVFTDRKQKVTQGCIIDEETSQKIFRRTGEVSRIEFTSTFN
jgi:hypothetical protein